METKKLYLSYTGSFCVDNVIGKLGLWLCGDMGIDEKHIVDALAIAFPLLKSRKDYDIVLISTQEGKNYFKLNFLSESAKKESGNIEGHLTDNIYLESIDKKLLDASSCQLNLKSDYWREKDPNNLPNFDHGGHRKFYNEAMHVCLDMIAEIKEYNLKFSNKDHSSQKATWMLYTVCLSQVKEVLDLIQKKKIISSSPLLREIWEKYVAIFFLNNQGNKLALEQFYNSKDYDVTGSKYIRSAEIKNSNRNKELKNLYRFLSHFVHPNYMALREFFNMGGDNNEFLWSAYNLVSTDIISPSKISQHYWILAQIMKWIISDRTKILNFIDKK